MADAPTVLIPLKILKGESIPEGIPELLQHAHVVILGYHVIPEQTAAGQARMQFEERAENRLEAFASMLEAAGATTESHLVFTHEAQKTIDRMIDEHACQAVLVPRATTEPENVLVAVRGTVGMGRIGHLVAGLFADTDINITLVHITKSSSEKGDELLATLAADLEQRGFPMTRIESEVLHGGHPLETLSDMADQFNALVLGESDPSLITFVFGLRSEEIADRFLSPVLIVQREREID